MDWSNIGFFLIFALVMFFMHRNGGGCCGGGGKETSHDPHEAHETQPTLNTQPANFAVEGMTCGHCVQTVEKALFAIRGVVSVDVSLETNRVKATYDPTRTNLMELKDAIRKAGYNPN
jgi:copper ion binding protein